MSGLPPSASAAEIEDEIVFTQLLMDTLDPQADDYETRHQELEDILSGLEARFVAQGLPESDGIGSPPELSRDDLGAASGSSTSGSGNTSGESEEAAAQEESESSYMTANEQDSAIADSPPHFEIPSRKRPRQESNPHIVGRVQAENKSRRIDNLPGSSTAASKPLSTSHAQDHARTGTGFQHGSQLTNGGNFSLSPRRVLQRQREAEQRARQQQRDAELARSLQNGDGIASASLTGRAVQQPAVGQAPTAQRSPFSAPAADRPTPTINPAQASSALSASEISIPIRGSPRSATVKFDPWATAYDFQPQRFQYRHGEGLNLPPTAPSVTNTAAQSNNDSDLQEIVHDLFMSTARPEGSSSNARAPRPNPSSYQPPQAVKKEGGFHSSGQQMTALPFFNSSQTQGQSGQPFVSQSSSSAYTPYTGTPALASNPWDMGLDPFHMYDYDLGYGLAIGGYSDGYEGLDHLINGNGGLLGGGETYGFMADEPAAYPPGNPAPKYIQPPYQRQYDYLYSDPTKTKEEINKLLENIRPDEDLPPEMREGTPDAMKYPLMEHQKLGLTWLKNMEAGSNKGGILADDMGLGKTIQALALLVSRPSDDPRRKTTLIIAPLSLMRQWEREIRDKLKQGRRGISVFVQHGPGKKRSFRALRDYDVVLTTFGTLACELKKRLAWDKIKAADPDAVPGRKHELALIGDDCKWYRVIIDEAQCIKNKKTATAQAAYYLQSVSRFCMTGTPMMNNIGELFSLIHFLRIRPYNEWEKFNHDFLLPFRSGTNVAKDAAMRKLQALLKAILMRRTKQSKIDGEPILRLPPRTTEERHAEFSHDEDEFYRALETRTQLQFNRYLRAGTVGRNYSNILVLLLRLRQACCHPHLIKDFGVSTSANLTAEEMVDLAKKFSDEVVARIKGAIGSFECPVCYDAVENPAIFFPCGHDTCSECFARITDPSRAIAEGDATGLGVKCPECRAQVDSKHVVDYATFKKVHMPDHLDPDDPTSGAAADAETESDTEDDDSDADESEDETDSLNGFIVDDAEAEESGGESKAESMKKAKKDKTKTRKDRKGKGKAKEPKKTKTLAELKKEGMRSAAAKRKYLRRLRRDWQTSAKIERTLEILREIMAKDKAEKTIIFSQFTSLLDLLEVPIDREGWGYKRYDGSMSANLRNDAVLDFTERPACRIMLVSLKAGNAGLNLTAASQVIILDPFWNPYIEEQAIDRAHRIGQLKPVHVHRILIQGTVEDRILALQESKRKIISTALDEQAGQSVSRLGLRELAYLFGVTNNPNEAPQGATQ